MSLNVQYFFEVSNSYFVLILIVRGIRSNMSCCIFVLYRSVAMLFDVMPLHHSLKTAEQKYKKYLELLRTFVEFSITR